MTGRIVNRAASMVITAVLSGGSLGAQAPQDLGSEAQRAEGQVLYAKYCSQCHGDTGAGDGPAADRVKPEPRDFTSGKYKFRSTPSGKLPTDADLTKVIRVGLPYTSMPGWKNFTDQQVKNLIYYLKSFSADFQNPEMYGEPIAIGEPLATTDESLERGAQLYEEQGCAACHGLVGRGDGNSAPTLTDDWGHHIRVADLSQRWTWRGGAGKADIFRTFSTGLNGTPMPSYAQVLEPEDRWHLVNYIHSLGDSDQPGYDTLALVPFLEDELDLSRGAELFANAPLARFPLIGQITEPGRDFYPSTTSIELQAVYNRKEIAFLVRWHDMRADSAGRNSPTEPVPPWDQDQPASGGGGGDDFFGDAAASDDSFFGAAESSGAAESPAGDDFFGEDDAADSGGAGAGEWSDAIALQFPAAQPTGNRKPYFLFGDSTSAVDLWFVDLARSRVEQFQGRGSASLEPVEADDFETVASYDQGEWTVIMKRGLRAASGISVGEAQYVPIAFSVWDGFNRERGNKRAVSSWFYFYTEPVESISPIGPMTRAALITLVIELLLIYFVRQRQRQRTGHAAQGASASLAGDSVTT